MNYSRVTKCLYAIGQRPRYVQINIAVHRHNGHSDKQSKHKYIFSIDFIHKLLSYLEISFPFKCTPHHKCVHMLVLFNSEDIKLP